MAAAVAMETKHHSPAAGEGTDCQETGGSVREAPVAAMSILSSQQWSDAVSKFQPPLIPSSATAPLPISSSPRATRTGPIKTGGIVQVLDHGRWIEAMRAAIDGLLGKHHRAPRMLKRVDQDYVAMVQRACTDPKSLFHPTTCQYISRYVKHLAKLKNTSSSLNTSPEKVLETQQLWQSLTTDSQTVSVPVTTLPPATLNPPPVAPPQEVSLSRVTVEKIVAEILEKYQQQQKKTTRNCLACGQPKSRYLGDCSSVHFFFQSPTVKYFYCSTKVFKTYAGKGLKDPRMSFEDFAASPFFERELEAAKQRGAEWRKVAEERKKRESAVQLPTGRLCRFCHKPLKQGPSSPHVHSSFPGVSGKYIYCPSRVFSLYKDQGMVTEMTWGDFSQSDFYEAERDRWISERK